MSQPHRLSLFGNCARNENNTKTIHFNEKEKDCRKSEKIASEIQNAQKTPRLDKGVSIFGNYTVNYIDLWYDWTG